MSTFKKKKFIYAHNKVEFFYKLLLKPVNLLLKEISKKNDNENNI